MFHCPKCGGAAHVRTSRYLSDNTKERYLQCTNLNCSCTFVTMETLGRFLSVPHVVKNTASAKTFFVNESTGCV